jgi:hypothetical protein
MKVKYFTLNLLFFIGLSTAYAQVGVGTTTPNASSVLELQSTEKGFLPPRMTTAQRDGITNPVKGLMIYNMNQKCVEIYNGVRWIAHNTIGATDVYNPITGQVWMDRNLGASQVATSPTDVNSYGDIYQWGRAADGHEKRVSQNYDGTSMRPTTITQTGAWDAKFIIVPVNVNRNDWVTTQTNDAWNIGTEINPSKSATDPCPNGYRLPTESELNAERLSWGSNNSGGAFSSPLKLPLAGGRGYSTGSFFNIGSVGGYWSSTISGIEAKRLDFHSSNASMEPHFRARGSSVRCIKE